MAANEETTEVIETDVKSDEDLVVEVLDDVDAVEDKTDEEAEVVEAKDDTEATDSEETTEETEVKDDEVEVEEVEEFEVELKDTLDDDVEEKTDEETEEEVEAKDDLDPALEALLGDVDVRTKHLAAIGIENPEAVGEDEFLCGIERKMLKGEPCAHCRGGCMPEGEQKELPGLLDVELLAEEEYGTVLKSGYTPKSDLFILDVARKSDGKVIEVAYSGEGENMGWLMLDQKMVESKDALAGQKVISMEEASEVAVKELGGEAKSVVGSLFEGFDAYAVQIETEEKSFDVYVRLDGEVLGYDEFVLDEKTAEEDAETKVADAGTGKLTGQVEAITDVETLKAILTAIGDDADEVPEDVRMALVKKAKEYDVLDLLPEGWYVEDDEEEAPEAEATEATDAPEVAAAAAEPAVAAGVVVKKDAEEEVEDVKSTDELLSDLEEFESLMNEDNPA
jgi:hypothetical protein